MTTYYQKNFNSKIFLINCNFELQSRGWKLGITKLTQIFRVIPLPKDNRIPQDVLHISQGLDAQKLVDYAQLVQSGKLDGESLQWKKITFF